MASLTIRKLDDGLKGQLRLRAATHGRSMEEEARVILKDTLARSEGRPIGLAAAIRRRMAPLGGVELPSLPPELVGDPPDIGE